MSIPDPVSADTPSVPAISTTPMTTTRPNRLPRPAPVVRNGDNEYAGTPVPPDRTTGLPHAPHRSPPSGRPRPQELQSISAAFVRLHPSVAFPRDEVNAFPTTNSSIEL